MEKRRLTKELAEKIDEKSERVKILEEHLKNVKSELLNTQALVGIVVVSNVNVVVRLMKRISK